MAFRLRITSQTTLSLLIDCPAMLALPPGGVPQPVPLFALIQPCEQNRAVATLLLLNEVSVVIIPMSYHPFATRQVSGPCPALQIPS